MYLSTPTPPKRGKKDDITTEHGVHGEKIFQIK
jgi:hypothetical protein